MRATTRSTVLSVGQVQGTGQKGPSGEGSGVQAGRVHLTTSPETGFMTAGQPEVAVDR